jgi:hypothetical protein
MTSPLLVLLAILTFATLLVSGCANGDFISTSVHPRDQHGYPQVDPFVDWSKPASEQPGPTYPQYEGIGTP